MTKIMLIHSIIVNTINSYNNYKDYNVMAKSEAIKNLYEFVECKIDNFIESNEYSINGERQSRIPPFNS